MKKFSIALLAVVAASAWAQQPKVVGKLINVTGLVTVSSGSQLANAANGAPLLVDSRIVTTSTGGVTLNFDNGCDVTLKANESITVKDNSDCAALWAAVQPVGVPATAVAAGSSLLGPGMVLAGGGLIYIISRNNQNKTSGS